MLVIIKTEDNKEHEFRLMSSPYDSFAELVVAGYSDWKVDVSKIVEAQQHSSVDYTLLTQSWMVLSNRVLNYLQAEDLCQTSRVLEKSHRPGDTLEQLVNS